MGLDLGTMKRTDRNIHVGSYNYTHEIRAELVRAYILYLDPDDPRTQPAREEFAAWLDASGDVDYAAVAENDPSGCWDNIATGLELFVNHSDCDGYLWEDDVHCVAVMLQTLQPYVRQDMQDDIKDLAEFFEQASTHGEVVMFG